jgi:hypothetical protein
MKSTSKIRNSYYYYFVLASCYALLLPSCEQGLPIPDTVESLTGVYEGRYMSINSSIREQFYMDSFGDLRSRMVFVTDTTFNDSMKVEITTVGSESFLLSRTEFTAGHPLQFKFTADAGSNRRYRYTYDFGASFLTNEGTVTIDTKTDSLLIQGLISNYGSSRRISFAAVK